MGPRFALVVLPMLIVQGLKIVIGFMAQVTFERLPVNIRSTFRSLGHGYDCRRGRLGRKVMPDLYNIECETAGPMVSGRGWHEVNRRRVVRAWGSAVRHSL